ncbi:MAG: hypothetical protein IPP32_00015 [Bacteroidetes bacterium]|nr:hypothetical protein [Bacteroidota bacterium]
MKDTDIMFVDFYDGADYIQRSAIVIVEILNTIKARQASGGYAHQPTVVLGASMGGQTARYALDYMEQHNLKHCVRNYISFDSPHNGANIPISLQQWLEFFAHNGRNGGSISAQQQLIRKLNRPATRQLLVKHYDDGNSYTFTDRINYQAEIDGMGFPQKCRKVAVACGSKFGSEQDNLSAGQQLLKTEWTPSLCLNTTFMKGDCYAIDQSGSMTFSRKAFKTAALACFPAGFLNSAAGLGPNPSTILAGTMSCAACASASFLFDSKTKIWQLEVKVGIMHQVAAGTLLNK